MKKYASDTAATKQLASALKTLPDRWVACRDLRHAWLKVVNDFHVVVSQSAKGGARAPMVIRREVQCSRCETVRPPRHGASCQGRQGRARDGRAMSTCGACGQAIPNKTTFTPRRDGMYDVVTSVDTNALLEHLQKAHPAPSTREVRRTGLFG